MSMKNSSDTIGNRTDQAASGAIVTRALKFALPSRYERDTLLVAQLVEALR
jgi:hypothetical protein